MKDEQPETIIGVTPVADKKCRYFLGKDYSNSYEKDFEFIDKFDEGESGDLSSPMTSHSIHADYIDRKCSPRMPWHDEALVVTGHAARRLCATFHSTMEYSQGSFVRSFPSVRLLHDLFVSRQTNIVSTTPFLTFFLRPTKTRTS